MKPPLKWTASRTEERYQITQPASVNRPWTVLAIDVGIVPAAAEERLILAAPEMLALLERAVSEGVGVASSWCADVRALLTRVQP